LQALLTGAILKSDCSQSHGALRLACGFKRRYFTYISGVVHEA
jgi:hypothetical protein